MIGSLLLLLATAGAAAAPSPGCGRSMASGNYELVDQHVTRNYRLFVPARYRPGVALPLIVVFHGWGGDEGEFLDSPVVTALADQRGYILAAPRGLGSGTPDASRNSWTFRGSATGIASVGAICDAQRTPDYTYPSCRNVAHSSCSWTQCQADDVQFTLALIHEIESKLCVDSARIFATGGSNGGMFTWELGQNAVSAATFKAIAPVIGLPHRGFGDPPAKKGGLPVLLITGRADPTVPPGPWENADPTATSDGNVYFYESATAMMRRWGALNGCAYRASPATVFHTEAGPSECRTYCARDLRDESRSGANDRWPRALDCRAPMAHDYGLEWSWRLTLDFFDAQGR